MNLAKLLNVKIDSIQVILVGVPEETNFVTSDDEPYYSCKLASPITVRCSIDKDILPFDTDEVFVRRSAIAAEGWKFVDDAKPELGFYMPDWKVDFSKGQQLAVYQETTIAKWTKANRSTRRDSNRDEINNRIRQKIEDQLAGK